MTNINNKYISNISIEGNIYNIYDIEKACQEEGFSSTHLPVSLKILLENILRNYRDDKKIKEALQEFKKVAEGKTSNYEIEFVPTRVLMQDFTGVPAIVDLVAMREAIVKIGGDPNKINPQIQVDLVIDHSIQVDFSGDVDSYDKNNQKEIERNLERYKFLKWGQTAFSNFRVIPPGTGICHQVNLEYLASVVMQTQDYLYPDTVVGTDSHTTMINGLSVLGWGVGGIEAEAAMLNQPIPIILPEIIGFKLIGKLNNGVTATDLVLNITKILRDFGVVGKFVEYFGSGVKNLSLADRATISNMSPEYGATCGFFPIDEKTIEYLNLTGREESKINIIKAYTKAQNLWHIEESEAKYTKIIELDISTIKPSMAGPKRPQDMVLLEDVKSNFLSSIKISKDASNKKINSLQNGSVVIAAITSCTNTSNPFVMIGAGLVAKKAVELGLSKQKWVKASLAPGSQVVTEYLNQSGLSKYLDMVGFNLVGYGCTTCIGNSGPLDKEIEKIITDNNLIVASVLSGNRNFEGRVHPLTSVNYLASPLLVVVYALVGNLNIDITKEPLGFSADGTPVFLDDIWPSNKEIEDYINKFLNRQIFIDKYKDVYKGNKTWQEIEVTNEIIYQFNSHNTYINKPPFLNEINEINNLSDITNARILAIFGDSFTTDHISPAGNIAKNSPAAKYLREMGVQDLDFNSYGSRRGNHEVMMRGTFANIRIKNKICSEFDGGFTKYFPDGRIETIYDAAMQYKEDRVPLVVFAGKEYGTGSSRDWAAKGPKLLGIKAVIAESFERIHRSNLIGMGILPLKIQEITIDELGLNGEELVTISGINQNLEKGKILDCLIYKGDKLIHKVKLQLCAFADNEIEYINEGGILNKVVKDLASVK
jgi:aconitate hydratase